VEVERSFLRALPSFSIVGLAGSSIQEAKERVKSALQSCNFTFPPKKITINLAPSDMKKSGSHFDLPIALSIVLLEEEIDENIFVFGELGLDGTLKDAQSIFPLVLDLAKKPIRVLAPCQSASKLSKIPNVTLYCARTLQEAIDFFKKGAEPLPKEELAFKQVKGYYYQEEYPLDFADVKGQKFALRAALVAAAGWHNILFEGSPGCGKSMIAKRLRYVLPPMSLEEILEVAKLEALEGKEPTFSPLRPFRSPHHSATKASVFGGGSGEAKPGEVAFANRGILFFDELPHFAKSVLEALREPLQEKKILISRVNSKVEYPADFLFTAAQNPCPCGNLFSTTKECRCTELEIKRYRSKISEPLLDRIDLYVRMSEVEPNEEPSITSAAMHKKVREAFFVQIERQGEPNGKLSEAKMERYCQLDSEAEELLRGSIERLGLSLRRIGALKRVARTIADLDGSESIRKSHLLEALGYVRR
jgi:magnesium chelatase family protein